MNGQRGEFEKTIEYNERMLNKEKVLDDIASKIFSVHHKYAQISLRLLNYDADKELYNVEIHSHLGKNYSDLRENHWIEKSTINVDVETAIKMKSIQENHEKDYEDGWHCMECFLRKKSNQIKEDFVITKNGYFLITKFIFEDKYYPLSINNPYTNFTELSISAKELGLSKYFDNDYQISKIKLLPIAVDYSGNFLNDRDTTLSEEQYDKLVSQIHLHLLNKIQGKIGSTKVKVKFIVDVLGNVRDFKIECSHPDVKKEMELTIPKVIARWEPAIENGIYVESECKFTFDYKYGTTEMLSTQNFIPTKETSPTKKVENEKKSTKNSKSLKNVIDIAGGLLNILAK